MFKRYVVVHPCYGIYLGNALGLGFWSKLDSVGQPMSVTFESAYQAIGHVMGFEGGVKIIGECQVHVVYTQLSGHASVAELQKAGLGDMLGDMVENVFEFAEKFGAMAHA